MTLADACYWAGTATRAPLSPERSRGACPNAGKAEKPPGSRMTYTLAVVRGPELNFLRFNPEQVYALFVRVRRIRVRLDYRLEPLTQFVRCVHIRFVGSRS